MTLSRATTEDITYICDFFLTGTSRRVSRRRMVKSVNNLSPKCKKLYRKCVQIIKSKRLLMYNVEQKLEIAKKLSEENSFDELVKNMTPQAKTFLHMQISQNNKHIKGRRFTNREKLLALTIMKQSPKAYKLLQKIFILPSKRTLNKFLQNLTIEPGLNIHIIKQLQEYVKQWDVKKRLCSIVFDEVALSPHLTFVEHKDKIDGFVNFGQSSQKKFCDHALVFMVRGICFSWRQPIAYYLCEGTTPAITLKNIIKVGIFLVNYFLCIFSVTCLACLKMPCKIVPISLPISSKCLPKLNKY